MFQAAPTTHDNDADSAYWTRSSYTTDDRSSARFYDEQVSECVYVYHEYMCIIMLSEKSVQLCTKADNYVLELTHADNICVVESSRSSSVMHALHAYNFESLSTAHVLSMCTDTDS